MTPNNELAPLPKVFIGSSSAAIEICKYLQHELQKTGLCVPEVWDQGVFTASSYTLEALTNTALSSDFAILVVTPDDFVTQGETILPTPRDNVILELGLFVAALGRDRTYMVVDKTQPGLKLPTDVLGVTYLPFNRTASTHMGGALVGPVLSISERIRTLGLRENAASKGETLRSRAAIGVPGSHHEIFEVRDGSVWHRWSVEGGWSDWHEKPLPSGVSAVHVGAGAHGQFVDLVASSTDGHLFHQWWGPDTSWTNWSQWPEAGVSGPFAFASLGEDHNEFWATRNGELQHQWFNGRDWSGWRDFE